MNLLDRSLNRIDSRESFESLESVWAPAFGPKGFSLPEQFEESLHAAHAHSLRCRWASLLVWGLNQRCTQLCQKFRLQFSCVSAAKPSTMARGGTYCVFLWGVSSFGRLTGICCIMRFSVCCFDLYHCWLWEIHADFRIASPGLMCGVELASRDPTIINPLLV